MLDKYIVYITYAPPTIIGMEEIPGTNEFVEIRSDEYWIASMPEIKLTATGSSQTDALNNLLSVSPSNTHYTEPLSNVRTW